RVGHGAMAPERESRLQPVCGRNRLKPGLLGRCPVSQGTQHAVGPTRIIFSDSLSQKNSQREFFCEKERGSSALPEAKIPFG
ncbi:MAG: hypothetical protein ACLFVO_29565, partial [Chloroflexaceae bacterium]